MILQNGSSHRVDCDLITGRPKSYINIKYQSPNTQSETLNRNLQKYCSEKNIMSSSGCRAQQRLINLTTKSKINEVQPKLHVDSSCRKKSVDPKPPFICKVQNYEHINTPKTMVKSSNPIVKHNGCYEYYPKEPVFNRDFTIKKTILNDYKKVNEKFIKEKINNTSQIVERNLHLSSTPYEITEKKSDNYKNNKKIENVTGTNEKIKDFSSREHNPPRYIENHLKKAISEKADLTDVTLNNFQQWSAKNEPSVSKVFTGNKQTVSKTRPLKISEALQLHERENESNPAHEIVSSSKNNESEYRFLPFSDDNISKFENLKISELHENFIVEKFKNPSKNNCIEDETEFNNRASRDVFRTDNRNSGFLSYEDVSPQFTDLSTNDSSAAIHDTFRSRNSSNGHERFSISSKNYSTDHIQKTSSNNTLNPRNFEYNCDKSRSLLSMVHSTDSNNNSFNGLSDRFSSIERKNNSRGTSISSSEHLLSSQQDLSFVTPKKSFISEEADAVKRNFMGFKQWSSGNYPEESSMFTKDKQFFRKKDSINSRRDLSPKFYNGSNDKKFSDSGLLIKDHPKINKPLNSKAMTSKSDVNDSYRNNSHNFVSWDGFQQRRERQHKVKNVGSFLTSANPANKERFKISSVPSSKDIFKEYNTSRQQALKYAKSCSDLSLLIKSSDKYPIEKDTTRTSSCLAQQRLLTCKKFNM